MRRFVFWASVGFLLFLGLSGIQSCLSDWNLVNTPGQRACTIGQAVFGVFGVLAGIGAILKRGWAGPAAVVFAVSGGVTAGLATVAWGEASLISGVASGGLGLLFGTLLFLGITPRVSCSDES